MKVGEGISAFFPAYNDAPSLPGLLRRTFAALEQASDDFEVIVVNDGSRDETASVLEQMRQELGPRLRVVTHERNRGYGGALRSGFATATKDLVFYTDGDGQYDPAEIHLLLEQWSPDAGLVNGYKRLRQDPWHRVFIGNVYNRVARFLFGIRIRDIDCDFRLVRRALVSNLHLESTSGTICLELVRKIEMTGCPVAEVAVSHYPRLHGRSQFFRWQSLLSTARQFARLYWKLVALPFFAAKSRAAATLLTGSLSRKPSA
jgi:glycosyltransferase involved in cell wall biosynthesis